MLNSFVGAVEKLKFEIKSLIDLHSVYLVAPFILILISILISILITRLFITQPIWTFLSLKMRKMESGVYPRKDMELLHIKL